MELALSLGGDNPKPILFLEKSSSSSSLHENKVNKDIGFCMVLGKCNEGEDEGKRTRKRSRNHQEKGSSRNPSLQLDLLPFTPLVTRNTFPWLSQNLATEPAGLTNGRGGKSLEIMNRRQLVAEEGAALSSPNSEISSSQMNFPIFRNVNLINMRRDECDEDHKFGINNNNHSSSSRASDADDASARKNLDLQKNSLLFLKKVSKNTTLSTLTKLKQTEVDCEYLKKCCEILTEENKRLHKELQELRALKSSPPFYMQLPATTLTMCPSCERVATTATATTTTFMATAATASKTAGLHNHKLITLMTK
ncbi:unnamed protein product [Withania somnifera]